MFHFSAEQIHLLQFYLQVMLLILKQIQTVTFTCNGAFLHHRICVCTWEPFSSNEPEPVNCKQLKHDRQTLRGFCLIKHHNSHCQFLIMETEKQNI